MFHPLPVFLGVRSAAARRRRGYLSFITSVAIGGLALGTAVLILVLSVVNGFERELRERVLAVLPQLLLFDSQTFADWQRDAARLRSLSGVVGIAPLVGGPVLVATTGSVRAAQLSGIDPAHERAVSVIGRFVSTTSVASTVSNDVPRAAQENSSSTQRAAGRAGRSLDGLDALQSGAFRVLVGAGLARRLDVRVGQSISVVMSEAAVTPLGVFPRQKRFLVVGLVNSGTEVDDQAVYVHLRDAQKLYRLGNHVHALRLRMRDLFTAPATALAARAALSPARVQSQDWTVTHGILYQAILMQRTTMLLLLSLVIAVAAYNVVSSLVMVVTDKQREIAILRSLGLRRSRVTASFLVLGLIVGVIGVVVGDVVGLLAAYSVAPVVAALQKAFGLQLLAQYFVHYLPSEPRSTDVLLVSGIGLTLSLLASLYPARRAARLVPTEILRHE